MQVQSLTPHLGAIVQEIDLSEPMSETAFQALKAVYLDYSVLVFPDQALSQAQHKAFASRFGALHTHPMHARQQKGDPHILRVATNAESAYTAGEGWHTDVTCDALPPQCSLLYVTETPGNGGGDTMFADMYLAFELLSDPMKQFLSGLTAVHDGALPYVGAYKSVAPEGGYPRNEHPVIVQHPETGRAVLYVNSGFTSRIRGLSARESDALLQFLFRHIDSTPKLTARVSWSPNTLVLWDNRCTQHHSVWDYYPGSRYGERVSVIARERPLAFKGLFDAAG
ncbi:MAG: TauD/TfdA family dioxygenase [Pseudomonadales bacterium]|nr:TauD/TfdA family dioxygenase [Pseudomonadales bacterium]